MDKKARKAVPPRNLQLLEAKGLKSNSSVSPKRPVKAVQPLVCDAQSAGSSGFRACWYRVEPAKFVIHVRDSLSLDLNPSYQPVSLLSIPKLRTVRDLDPMSACRHRSGSSLPRGARGRGRGRCLDGRGLWTVIARKLLSRLPPSSLATHSKQQKGLGPVLSHRLEALKDQSLS